MAVRRRGPTKKELTGRDTGGGKLPVNVKRLAKEQDTPVRLLKEIHERRVDARTLTVDQRRACLVVLANGTQTAAELGEIFGVSANTIRRDVKTIREELGREVRDFSLEEVLGDLYHSQEKFVAMALKQEDPGLAWTIKRDWAKMLKDLGVIDSGHKQDKLTVTIEALGEGYERARDILTQRLTPALTGEVIETDILDPVSPDLPVEERWNGVPRQETDDEE